MLCVVCGSGWSPPWVRLPLETPTLIGRLVQGSGHLGAIDLTCVLFSGPDEPEEKPALGELNPEGREREALGIDSVRECEGELWNSHVELGIHVVYHQVPRVFPDARQQLVPPRFLEKFTSKKVKKGSSITFSVKVEGRRSRLPAPTHSPSREAGR